jgi:hypothetical protein
LLRNVSIERADQVWSTDITHIPDAERVHVSDGGDRLVQPLRAVVAAVEHARRGVLPGGAGRGVELGQAGGVSTRTRGFSSRRRRSRAGWSRRARR